MAADRVVTFVFKSGAVVEEFATTRGASTISRKFEDHLTGAAPTHVLKATLEVGNVVLDMRTLDAVYNLDNPET